MKTVFPLFSTPLYYNKVNLDLNLLMSSIKELEYEFIGNGYCSKDQKILENFPSIKRIVEEELKSFLRDELMIGEELSLKHTSSWVMKHLNGNHSPSHVHSNSMYSGILYLQCDDDSGKLEFVIPSMIPTWTSTTLNPEFCIKEWNIINSRIWDKIPKPKEIFIFPSHLYHGVSEHKSSIERYCISFNYILTGEYNMNTGYLKI